MQVRTLSLVLFVKRFLTYCRKWLELVWIDDVTPLEKLSSYAYVAQRVERRPEEPRVRGSSPFVGTFNVNEIGDVSFVILSCTVSNHRSTDRLHLCTGSSVW